MERESASSTTEQDIKQLYRWVKKIQFEVFDFCSIFLSLKTEVSRTGIQTLCIHKYCLYCRVTFCQGYSIFEKKNLFLFLFYISRLICYRHNKKKLLVIRALADVIYFPFNYYIRIGTTTGYHHLQYILIINWRIWLDRNYILMWSFSHIVFTMLFIWTGKLI